MIELKCKNCGAPLVKNGYETYKCEYCGSMYKEEIRNGQIVYIEIVPPGCRTYGAQQIIDFEAFHYYPKEILEKEITNNIIRSFDEAIKENIRITERRDPYTNRMVYEGKLRIVPYDYTY